MWIRRPNVVNRKLVGVVSLLEAPLALTAWAHLNSDPSSVVTVKELVADAPQSDNKDNSKVIVREFLCRERGSSPCPELVVIGVCLESLLIFILADVTHR